MPISSLEHDTSIAKLISRGQDSLELSDAALAYALGYDSPKVISLIKTQRMRLPINKARALAEALALEPGEVMRALLREASPEMLRSIEECLGPLDLTNTEKRLVLKLRESAGGQATTPLFLDGNTVMAVVVQK